MKREVIRVEPLSTYLERWRAPTSAVTRLGNTIYVSGFPPFDPATGEVVDAPIGKQAELVLDQMKLCLEAAGSSLEHCSSATSTAPRWRSSRSSMPFTPATFPRIPRQESSSTCPRGPDISILRSTVSPQSRTRSKGVRLVLNDFRQGLEVRSLSLE